MPGPRAKDDKQNIEGSGYNYNDAVTVDLGGDGKVPGVIKGIHQKGAKIDVTIDNPGHKQHGYTITVEPEKVAPRAAAEAAAAGEEDDEK